MTDWTLEEDEAFNDVEKHSNLGKQILRDMGQPYVYAPKYVAFMDVPHRPWVNLTEEEMKKTWYEMQNIMGWYSFEEIAKAIEAKLKEKNEKT
jgi:hypothetical protein